MSRSPFSRALAAAAVVLVVMSGAPAASAATTIEANGCAVVPVLATGTASSVPQDSLVQVKELGGGTIAFHLLAGDVYTFTVAAQADAGDPAGVGGLFVDNELVASGPVGVPFTYTVPSSKSGSAVSLGLNGAGSFSAVTCASPHVSGFGQPVDMGMVNQAKAGATVPFKFSVADAVGNPVTTLTASDVLTTTSSSAACSGPTDELEQTVSATLAGKLINNGGGSYQYNWKTEKPWADTCVTLGLRLAGSFVAPVTARFSFK